VNVVGVYDMVEFNGDLIVGGLFHTVGAEWVNHIVRWDGSNWYPMGEGFNARVRTLHVDNGTLMAGGQFTGSGGDPSVRYIAEWNGSSWTSIPDGPEDHVLSMMTWNDNLIVGGEFYRVGGERVGSAAILSDEGWSQLGPGNDVDDLRGPVFEFTEHNGQLWAASESFNYPYEGARFRITNWTGSEWAGYGTGADDTISALASYDGDLYVAGLFDEFNMTAGLHRKIVRWDGIEWSNLRTGISHGDPDAVYTLTPFGGMLTAGGSFRFAGGVPANNIAAWDGEYWDNLGQGANDKVLASGLYDNKLVAAGKFTEAGGIPANRIALWNGSSWAAVGSGVDGDINAVASYRGELIVGGEFAIAGGIAAQNLAAWDGAAWREMGGGSPAVIRSLLVSEGTLIAGGYDDAVTDSTAFLIRWNGSAWSSFGDGIRAEFPNPRVYALSRFGDATYVGGDFTHSGSYFGRNIAKWISATTTGVTSGTAPPASLVLGDVKPNPFNPRTVIQFEIPGQMVSTIGIYDIRGRLVRILADQPFPAGRHEISWDGRSGAGTDAPSGVYFVRINTGKSSDTKKIMLIR